MIDLFWSWLACASGVRYSLGRDGPPCITMSGAGACCVGSGFKSDGRIIRYAIRSGGCFCVEDDDIVRRRRNVPNLHSGGDGPSGVEVEEDMLFSRRYLAGTNDTKRRLRARNVPSSG